MKRIICLITALCLVLGSFSFAFAQDWSATDSNNLANIRASVMSGGQLYNVVNACNTALNNINYNLVTLMGWLDPATGGSTTALLNQILNALVYTNVGGATVSFLNDLRTENLIQSNYLLTIRTILDGVNIYPVRYSYSKDSLSPTATVFTMPWYAAIPDTLSTISQNTAFNYTYTNDKMYENAEYAQSYMNWSNLNSSTFTPVSGIDGIYKYLSYIQNPVARLSYVLASDERIEAQELAADNEQTVVDNFIDPTGSGAASTSDISSVSDLSSGYQENFGTDASISGIFNIFNSNNMGWFSTETYNQLDTTQNTRKGNSIDTPLLDKQIDDIYNAIGLENHD